MKKQTFQGRNAKFYKKDINLNTSEKLEFIRQNERRELKNLRIFAQEDNVLDIDLVKTDVIDDWTFGVERTGKRISKRYVQKKESFKCGKWRKYNIDGKEYRCKVRSKLGNYGDKVELIYLPSEPEHVFSLKGD